MAEARDWSIEETALRWLLQRNNASILSMAHGGEGVHEYECALICRSMRVYWYNLHGSSVILCDFCSSRTRLPVGSTDAQDCRQRHRRICELGRPGDRRVSTARELTCSFCVDQPLSRAHLSIWEEGRAHGRQLLPNAMRPSRMYTKSYEL